MALVPAVCRSQDRANRAKAESRLAFKLRQLELRALYSKARGKIPLEVHLQTHARLE
jgi:hypothetical protein